ncbi:MAG: ABC transporter [Desulfobacterales bacterium]|jgi:ABC-2 type transport system permease protein|nr:ABC transporter [Desulfobacterales bacterium]MDP6683892.1 ABC transporter [Desulfobacterales bacterium]MDP6808881.1 ABC transporter [Desulfobacterales bacterium]|tara:strand:+ start:4705 stop:5409 length:705 start_codon:yes stop_codon:yes gene_type:complete
MSQIVHIFSKELKDYFISPIAYIVISVFLLVTGWFFFSTFFLFDQADLRSFFNLLPITFSFVIPAVTMRLFAEELNVGSYETLFTLPVTLLDIVIGKFLAGVAFVIAMLLPTLFYPIFVTFFGELDWGPVFGGYVGAVFLGAAFSAIGLFASALTRNQIIAFIVGMTICFSLTVIDKMLFFFPRVLLGVITYLGIDLHFQNISKGVVDSRDIVYFLSIIFIGLYAAHLAMEKKE